VATLLALLAFVALTAGNAFFVVAEYSLVTVDRATVDRAAANGDETAQAVAGALRGLSFQLSGAQLGITVTTLLTGYLAEPALARIIAVVLSPLGNAAAHTVAHGLALAVATLISVLFGELVPKNAAIARPVRSARITVRPLRRFSGACRWIITFLNGTANALIARLGVVPQKELASARSPDELGLLAAYSARAGTLPEETALLLRRTIRFGDKRAAEAMTPRVDVVGVNAGDHVQDVIDLIRATGKSRFPVFLGSLDEIVGVVSLIDLLGVDVSGRATTAVSQVARDAVLVPESLDLDGVLRELQAAGQDLAIVVDEYGGTDGVVTIEDLVEELVGEIADEHDQADQEPTLQDVAAGPTAADGGGVTDPNADRVWNVDGMLRSDELADLTGFRLPEGPYETLAGFVMARLGHIPTVGEALTYQDWEFTVVEVQRHRVEQVRVGAPARGTAGASQSGFEPGGFGHG
jgi:CBS domain containing-hemolysin-like protein